MVLSQERRKRGKTSLYSKQLIKKHLEIHPKLLNVLMLSWNAKSK